MNSSIFTIFSVFARPVRYLYLVNYVVGSLTAVLAPSFTWASKFRYVFPPCINEIRIDWRRGHPRRNINILGFRPTRCYV